MTDNKLADALRIAMEWNWLDDDARPSRVAEICDDALAEHDAKAAPAPQGSWGALLNRAYEVVHHDTDCPSIGGNGDADCRCDAVPFLHDLKKAIAALQQKVTTPALPEVTDEDEAEAWDVLLITTDSCAGGDMRKVLESYRASLMAKAGV